MAAQRTSTSPSPPPQAPVTAAPGPRASKLQQVFTGAISSSLKANSYANFSSCFPTPAKYCPSALEGVWKQLNTRLEEECVRDFEKILSERSVVEGLNQWDALIDDARRRKNRAIEGEDPGRPPHTLSADELYNAHIASFLQQTSSELETKLRATQQNNQQEMETINAQRAEMEQLISGLESVIGDVQGSVEALTGAEGANMGELKQDVWEMEQEVAATR